MKFSIIVPVYNCAKSLHISVGSIIDQTYSDWELILVNDGSKDDSLEICRKYAEADPRIVVIDQKNAGAGAARNCGIHAAKGEYLVFCDADDFYDDNALETYARFAKDEIDLVISSYHEYQITSGKEIVLKRECLIQEEYLDDTDMIRAKYITLRKQGMINAPWAKAYRRDTLLKNNLLFPDLSRCEDNEFNLVAFEYVKRLYIIPNMTYNYQVPNDGSYLRKFPAHMFDIHKEVFRMTTSKLKQWGVYDEEAKEYLARCLIKDASILLRLNYQNNWHFSADEKREYARTILNDSDLVQACQVPVKGTMDSIIRFVLSTKRPWIVNIFSFGTLVYQSLRKG